MKVGIKAGGLATLTEQINGLNAATLPKAAKGLARGLGEALKIASLRYLSGPRPQRLDVVTARLRNSLTTKVYESPTAIRGVLGTNIPYAAYHELGFHGTINVRAHTRTVAEFYEGREIDSRRPIKDRAGNIIGYKESRTRSSARFGTIASQQRVGAHQRRVNYAGRPFLRPALKAALPVIVREIQAELAK